MRSSVSGSESRRPASPPRKGPKGGLREWGRPWAERMGAKGANQGLASLFDPFLRRGGVFTSRGEAASPGRGSSRAEGEGASRLGLGFTFFFCVAFGKKGDRLPLRFARASRPGCAPHPGKESQELASLATIPRSRPPGACEERNGNRLEKKSAFGLQGTGTSALA